MLSRDVIEQGKCEPAGGRLEGSRRERDGPEAPEGRGCIATKGGRLMFAQAHPEDGVSSADRSWTRGAVSRRMATEGDAGMKPIVVVGIVLIVFGLVVLAYQGIPYTTREKVVEVGPVEVTAEKEETVRFPPILGAAAVGTGLVLVVVGSRRS